MKKLAQTRYAKSGRNLRAPASKSRGAGLVKPASALSYAEVLSVRAAEDQKPKGQRTRGSLVVAAAALLEEVGYRNLRVSDINEKAGVSNALFYVYFKNKEEITCEVLTGFIDVLYAPGTEHARPTSTEESIYWANLDYARRFASNSGLMRCLLQFGDELPEFGRLWGEAGQRWIQRVVVKLSKEPELEHADPDELWSEATALGMMVDGFLRLLYIDRAPATILHAGAISANDERLALFLTQLWVRGIFGREMKWRPPLGAS